MASGILLFYLLAATAITSALLVVTLKNLSRALFLLFVTLFAVAGLYIFAMADFVALTQVIVYVGGVLVLMLFAFMLSNKELLSNMQLGVGGFLALPRWHALFVAACFLAILLYTGIGIARHPPQWVLDAKLSGHFFAATDNTVQHIGMQLMTRYLLPFELISIVLMMALIGAAHIARKEPDQ